MGITRFDLLGDFGRFNWLGNFYIVLSYNLLFAIMTTLCLIRKFTSAVREELFKALGLHKLHLSDTSRDSETTKPSANGHQKALNCFGGPHIHQLTSPPQEGYQCDIQDLKDMFSTEGQKN
ncbi:Limb region 1 protein [Apodemus speciosus]|uniref:Limb region 1 protein n=1 Tax=Apodemus speciosus TaxID=105296 RepID=A0ABQ0ER11_APOSI